ncbi:MAG: YkvA family protein [Bacillota bacterium]
MSKNLAGLINIIRFLKDSDVKISKKALFLVPIAYLIFPFDLISDFFPVIGQLDDIAVFILMWPFLKTILNKYNEGNPEINKEKKADPDAVDLNKNDYTVE